MAYQGQSYAPVWIGANRCFSKTTFMKLKKTLEPCVTPSGQCFVIDFHLRYLTFSSIVESFNLKPCLIYSITSSIFYWKLIPVKSVCNQFDWTCVTKWPFLCLVREMILWNLTKWAIFSSLSVSSSTSPLVVDDFKNLASTKLSSALLFYRNNELNSR